MPSHREEQILPYDTLQLFNLVADIERYPEFLPWCRAARILSRDESGVMAELVICFKHMTEHYTSRVTFDRPATGRHRGAIDVTMVEGPFEHLVNRWHFVPLPEGGTRIEFFVDFRFKSRILDMMIGGLFTKATAKMGAAFREHADALYGAARLP